MAGPSRNMSTASASVEYPACWPRTFLPPETIRRYQNRALRPLLRHAATNVPYYRQLFAASGLHPEDIRGVADLARIPITEKIDLQQAVFADRLASGVDRAACRIHETSGSTGEVMRIARTPAEELRLFGRRLRAQVFSGLRPWSRRVLFGSTPRRLLPHRLGLFRVNSVELGRGPEPMMEELELRRPHVVKGPPNALGLLAEKYPERLAALRFQRVFTGAEQLSPHTRRRIEDAFGCPVIDFYGAVECNLIAWQCLRCGIYHTCDDSVIVEVVRGGRPAQPGEDGEVVITALHSYAMPFIRYRIGDMVRVPAARPSCPIAFGAIESVQGRIVDYLRFSNGVRVSPYTVMDELDILEGLQRYEVAQVGPAAILIRFQPVDLNGKEAMSRLVRAQCEPVLPRKVEIQTEAVERFEVSLTEKRRFVTGWRGDD
jgi:phenylacetate-CoA ligase